MKTLRLLTLAVVIAGLTSVSAFADTISSLNLAPNLNATAHLSTTGSNFTFTLSIVNSGLTSATIKVFSIQLFSGAITVTTASLPSGWQYFANEKTNNGPGGVCTSNGHPGWLCADKNGGSTTIAANSTLTFSFTGTFAGSEVNPFHLMANGLIGDAKWAVSNDLTHTTNTPEPASLFLMGTGLISAGSLVRKRFGSK